MGKSEKPDAFLTQRTPPPKNAPGPFYVADGECIACLALYAGDGDHIPCEALERSCPDIMGHVSNPDGSGYHCFVKKQPETSNELDQAIEACKLCFCRAVRYAGNEPRGLERLASARICDALSGLTPSQVRWTIDRAIRREAATGDPMWDRETDG